MVEVEQQKQEQQQQQKLPLGPRIYQVTDEGKSYYTKQAYRLAFNHFLKVTVKNDDLRTLLDTRVDVIQAKIIDHIIYLRDVRKLSYWTLQVHSSAILHFFEMNDIYLNVKKIKAYLPEDESDRFGMDRPYSVEEIERILSKCDVRSKVIIHLTD